jgi:hypothetical protein
MWEVFTGSVAFDRQHYGEVFEVRGGGKVTPGLRQRSHLKQVQPSHGVLCLLFKHAFNTPHPTTHPTHPPQRVVLLDERPPVPDNMPEAYALLMTSCWRADPMSRPGFDTVLRLINLMIEDMLAPEDCGPAAPGGDGSPGSAGGIPGSPGDAARAGAGQEGAAAAGAPPHASGRHAGSAAGSGTSGGVLGGGQGGPGGGARRAAAPPREAVQYFQDL